MKTVRDLFENKKPKTVRDLFDEERQIRSWADVARAESAQQPKPEEGTSLLDDALELGKLGLAQGMMLPNLLGGLATETAGNILQGLGNLQRNSLAGQYAPEVADLLQSLGEGATDVAETMANTGTLVPRISYKSDPTEDTPSKFIDQMNSAYTGALGNVARFLHADRVADAYVNKANELCVKDEERPAPDFTLDYLLSGLPVDFGELTGSMAAIAPAMAALPESAVASMLNPVAREMINRGMYGAAKVFSQLSPQALRYGLTSAPLEGIMEGGMTRENLLAQGYSDEEATKESAITALKNMALLLPTNTLEGLAMFSPLARAGKFATAGQIGGRGLLNTAQESYEEFAQEGIQNAAEGKPYSYNPFNGADNQYEAAKHVVGPAALMGLIGGGVGAYRGRNTTDEQRENQQNWNRGSQKNISNDDYAKRANLTSKQAEIWDAAQYASARAKEKYGYDIQPELIYKQWAHEAGVNFDSENARYNNNFGGLTQTEPNGEENKQPDGDNYYRHFNNVREYADAYVDDFIKHYPEISGVKNEREFANILKKYGYFGDTVENYASSMEGIATPSSQTDFTKNYESINFLGSNGNGEGNTWQKQNDGVSLDGVQPDLLNAIDVLGKWFYDRTGKRLVVTAGTNGTHADGEHSHAAGWKVDVNDWDGFSDGYLVTADGSKGSLTDEFIKFGQSIGLGMNWEGDHIDVALDGTQWDSSTETTNFGGFNPRKTANNQSPTQKEQQPQQSQQPTTLKPLFDITREDEQAQDIFAQFAEEKYLNGLEKDNNDEVDFFSGMFDTDGKFQSIKENRDAIRQNYADEFTAFAQNAIPKEQSTAQPKQSQPQQIHQTQSENSLLVNDNLRGAMEKYLDSIDRNTPENSGFALEIEKAFNDGKHEKVKSMLESRGISTTSQSDPVTQNKSPENILPTPKKLSGQEKMIRDASAPVIEGKKGNKKRKTQGKALINLAMQNNVEIPTAEVIALQNGSTKAVQKWHDELSKRGLFNASQPQSQAQQVKPQRQDNSAAILKAREDYDNRKNQTSKQEEQQSAQPQPQLQPQAQLQAQTNHQTQTPAQPQPQESQSQEQKEEEHKQRELWKTELADEEEEVIGNLDNARDQRYLEEEEDENTEWVQQERQKHDKDLQKQRAQEQSTSAKKTPIINKISGDEVDATTDSGKSYKVQYKVIEAKDLTASHVIDNGNVFANEVYPKELQPRDRNRSGMKSRLIAMAQNLNSAQLLEKALNVNLGAPTSRNDGVILNGNGRTAAIQHAYKNNHGESYKKALIERAKEFGLNSEDIAKMNQPVLVREMISGLTEQETRDVTNAQAGGEKLSASEQATADADKISESTLAIFPKGESIDFTNRDNAEFVNALLRDIATPSEMNNLVSDEGLTQDGVNRITRALFAYTYGNNQKAIRRVTESTDDNVKAITNSLIAAVPYLSKIKGMIEKGELPKYKFEVFADALEKLSALRAQGETLYDFLNQTTLFEEDTISDDLREALQTFETFKRSQKKLTQTIKSIARQIYDQRDSHKENLFGEKSEAIPLTKLIREARDEVANEGQKSLFSQQGSEVDTTDTKINKAVKNPDTAKALEQLGAKIENGNITIPDTATREAVTKHVGNERIFAWHGTPYDIENFSFENIGKGQGQGAHGWGLYFAKELAVAQNFMMEAMQQHISIGGIKYLLANDNLFNLSTNEEFAPYKRTKGRTISEEANELLKQAIFEEYGARFVRHEIGNETNITESLISNIKGYANYIRKHDIEDYFEKEVEKYSLSSSDGISDEYKRELKLAEERLQKSEERAKELAHQVEFGKVFKHLYKVEIPSPKDMIDEQKTLLEQPPKIRTAIEEILTKLESPVPLSAFTEKGTRLTGDKIYSLIGILTADKGTALLNEQLSDEDANDAIFNLSNENMGGVLLEQYNPERASRLLNTYGIKGMTYANSEEGRSYLVFDDKAIKILEKYSKQGKKAGEAEVDTTIRNYIDQKDLTPQQQLLQDFGRKLGTRVIFFDNGDGRFHGQHSNGITYLNVVSNMPLGKVFWHESMHWLKANNPKLYQQLVKAAGITDKQRQAYLERTERNDLKNDEAIDEEIIADQFEDVAKRSGLLQSIAGKNRGLIQRVIQWLQDTMKKFIEHFRNPQGKFTTKQAQTLADEFGRIAKDLVDPNGEQIFRYNRRTHNVELANGRDWNSIEQGSFDLASPAKYSFAGKKARTANKETLKQAKTMEKRAMKMGVKEDNKKLRDRIYETTGWFKGKDDKWRFEIPDNRNQMNISKLVEKGNFGKPTPLEQIYDNPELFAAYPRLRGITAKAVDPSDTGLEADLVRGSDAVTIGKKILFNMDRIFDDMDECQKTLVHELQHIIQDWEKFASGGNAQYIKSILNINRNKIKKAVANIPDGRKYFDSMLAVEKALKAGDAQALFKAYAEMQAAKAQLSDKDRLKVEEFLDRFGELRDVKADTKAEKIATYYRLGGEQESRYVESRLDDHSGTPVAHDFDALIVFGGKTYPLAKQSENKKMPIENGNEELVVSGSRTPPAATADGTTKRKPLENSVQADNKGGVRLSSANVETNSPSKNITQGIAESKPKYSIDASDNSNESTLQRIRNKVSAFFNPPPKSRNKRIKQFLEKLADIRIVAGHIKGAKAIDVDEFHRLLHTRKAYDWEKILPEIGGMLAKSLNLQDSDAMRNYVTDWLLTGAPNNNSAEAMIFQQAARNNPAMFEILQKIRDEFDEFNNLEPEERYAEGITDGDKTLGEKLGYYKENWCEEFTDDLHPIERMFNQAVAKADKTNPKLAEWLKESVNPYELARLVRGMGAVADILVGKVGSSPSKKINEIRTKLAEAYPNVNFSNFKPITMILEEIGALKDKKRQRLFEAFCVAKLDKEMYEKMRSDPKTYKNITPFRSESDADATIAKYEKEFGQAQRDLVHYSNILITMRYDAGLMSKSKYNEILSGWQNYIPTARVFEENEDYDFIDSLKQKTGSHRDIRTPIQKLIDNTNSLVKQAERNKVKCQVAQLARCGQFGQIIAVTENSKSNLGNTVLFCEHGKKCRLETPDLSIVRALNSIQSQKDGAWIVKAFNAAMSFFRSMLTNRNLDFAAGNIFRDSAAAYIHNKHLGHANPFMFFADVARIGLKGFWTKDSNWLEWQMFGGSQASFVSQDVDYVQRSISDITETGWESFKKHPLSYVLDKMQYVAEMSETATRLTTYVRARDALAKQRADGKATIDDKRRAALTSRNATIDFSRAGTSTRKANRVFAFANAAVQDFALQAQTFSPAQIQKAINGNKQAQQQIFSAAFRLVLMGIVPTLLQFALMHRDDDKEKIYRDLHDWEKETYWYFGDRVHIPKSMDIGIRLTSAITDEFLKTAIDKDPAEWKRFRRLILDAAPGLTATLATPAVEAWANYSFFRDAPIVPGKEQHLPGNLQYGHDTSPAAKFISDNTLSIAKIFGAETGFSPRKIDYMISGYFGFMGRFFSGGTDEYPIARRFIYEPYKNPKIVKDYYEAFNEQSNLYNGYKLELQRGKKVKPPEDFDQKLYGRLKSAQKTMQNLSKREKQILEDENLSSDQRKEKLRELELRRIGICERVFNKAR